MGFLHYSSNQVFLFEDRVLAHLRSVILGKLVLQESFAFTWNDSGAQRSVWMHPGLSLQFEFDSIDTHEINRSWIEALAATANSPGGLKLLPERTATSSS